MQRTIRTTVSFFGATTGIGGLTGVLTVPATLVVTAESRPGSDALGLDCAGGAKLRCGCWCFWGALELDMMMSMPRSIMAAAATLALLACSKLPAIRVRREAVRVPREPEGVFPAARDPWAFDAH